ncbi:MULTISPECIES: threonine aldolase family protein [Halorubrum]|uniref:Aromatic amino acid beta-eliminating lyase/threonine aldolase n=1 Tax=Halorubrum hochstenium ATCC 700873 TaxID=1227481 RepID=M0FMG8_9EURY|nr:MULTISPECIES: threonine aldolase [Halorubrum]ELZ61226.1 aromatic amino acid beta-eliminating lyase/threonine aldolase [Halorubrum hochstenium ATCC 700873]
MPEADELDIDLRSDTVTTPSDAMRDAAATAEVGDDVYRDDPTVNELEARAAEAVGTEAALYVPSGTMANQIAVHVHTEPGQELLLERESHIYRWELAGAAKLSGVQTRTIDAGDRCVPTPEAVREGLVDEDLHRPGTGLLAVENTHNYRGGKAVPVDRIAAAAEAARERDVPVHLDGARVFNAAVALGVDASEVVEPVDSVTFCLSKGLGAPVGSILAGDEAFVEDARRVRKLFGGGMRQAGMIAAPGLKALENVDRLADDHANAERLAAGLDALDGVDAPAPDTNIVVAHTEAAGIEAADLVTACKAAGVGCVEFDDHTTRFTTHLDVDADEVDAAVDRIAGVVEDLRA